MGLLLEGTPTVVVFGTNTRAHPQGMGLLLEGTPRGFQQQEKGHTRPRSAHFARATAAGAGPLSSGLGVQPLRAGVLLHNACLPARAAAACHKHICSSHHASLPTAWSMHEGPS
eukprot:354266-Chlamydomonas_euryale.AAC.24